MTKQEFHKLLEQTKVILDGATAKKGDAGWGLPRRMDFGKPGYLVRPSEGIHSGWKHNYLCSYIFWKPD